jgi:hypothetical protein
MGLPKAGGHAGPPLPIVVFQWEPDIRIKRKLLLIFFPVLFH